MRPGQGPGVPLVSSNSLLGFCWDDIDVLYLKVTLLPLKTFGKPLEIRFVLDVTIYARAETFERNPTR